jgi:hypothetical protein
LVGCRVRHQILPGQRDGIIGHEAAPEPEIHHPIRLLGATPVLPRGFAKGEQHAGIGFEFLEVRLA